MIIPLEEFETPSPLNLLEKEAGAFIQFNQTPMSDGGVFLFINFQKANYDFGKNDIMTVKADSNIYKMERTFSKLENTNENIQAFIFESIAIYLQANCVNLYFNTGLKRYQPPVKTGTSLLLPN